MKFNWSIIRLVVLFGLIVLLFSFTKARNRTRKLVATDIQFLDDNEPFITRAAVNKLLIQNHDSVTSIVKERLVLKEAEQRLLNNKMIRTAQVYVTVDGVLGAKIEQRNPIARVVALTDYYIDEEGKKMPLSAVYTARVPVVTGSSKQNFEELTPLLLAIRDDAFMKQSIIGLHFSDDGNVELQMRKQKFKVFFGKPKEIEHKFTNYKAFYQKTKQDRMLASYKSINLQFGNQVVATKK